LPLLCGLGTMIDVLIGSFTSATTNIWILQKEKGLSQLVNVPYENML